jgi:hypothetical protein
MHRSRRQDSADGKYLSFDSSAVREIMISQKNAISAKGQNFTCILYHEHARIATAFIQNKPAVRRFLHQTAGLSSLCIFLQAVGRPHVSTCRYQP